MGTKRNFEWKWGAERVLRGTFFPARGESKGTAIICHGYKGFKDWGFFPYLGERLAEDFDVVSFNFTHNGVGEDLMNFTELDKFARNTYTQELADLTELLAAVRAGELPGLAASDRPLFLLGHSRGAGVCLLYAMDYPGKVDGVVSWNGITRVDLYSAEEKAEMRQSGRAYVLNGRTKQKMPLDVVLLEDLERNKERFDILQRAATELKTPVVLIQGEKDGVYLRAGSVELMARCPDVIRYEVAGGDHTFRAVHPYQGTTPPLEEAIRLTRAWLLDMVNSAT